MLFRKLTAVLIILIMTAMLFSGCKQKEQEAQQQYGENEHPDSALEQEAGWRRTVLYLATEDSLMVPVMKKLPWEEGIAVAALNQLVSTSANMREASLMGLKTVIPDGTSFEVTIDDNRLATVNIIGMQPVDSAAKEVQIITAVVNTLTEFPTIDRVTMLIDGKAEKALPNGMPLTPDTNAFLLNVEEGDTSVSTIKSNIIIFYLPNSSCSLNIPVTRYSESEASFKHAVEEMLKGSTLKGTGNFFPQNTQILDASIIDNIASVNFSGEFLLCRDVDGLDAALYDAIYLTAGLYDSISELRLYVNGIEYLPDTNRISAPSFPNQFR